MGKIINKFDNEIVVIETTKYKRLKVYGICSTISGFGSEALCLIGYIKYHEMRREWCFMKSSNVRIWFRSDFLISINKYLEGLNKK